MSLQEIKLLPYRIGRNRWFAGLIFVLLSVVVLLSSVTSQVQADSIYLVPDLLKNIPYSYSMAVNNGNPVLSYYSKNTSKIVVASCGNPACETALTVINPIASQLLRSVAVTIINGNPFILYSTNEY